MRSVVAVVAALVCAAFGLAVGFMLGAGATLGLPRDGDDSSLMGVGAFRASAVPAQYRALFEAAAATCPQVPASLMAAQIAAESNWTPTAVSHANAQGIAQILPSTMASKGVDFNGDGRIDPYTPADAMATMARINCENLTQVEKDLAAGRISGDRWELTMAAYNAGYGAVLNARGVPRFQETQDYVAKITAGTRTYSEAVPAALTADGGNPTAVVAARKYLGVPYVWGGESARGLDCSGLVLLVVAEATGKSLPHLADAQIRSSLGSDVPPNYAAMRPGDIIGFSDSGGRNYQHIGVYIGDRRMIHAPRRGDVVKESSLDSSYYQAMTWKVKRF